MVLSEFCSALYWQAEKSSKRCVDLVLTHEDKLFYTWKKKRFTVLHVVTKTNARSELEGSVQYRIYKQLVGTRFFFILQKRITWVAHQQVEKLFKC